MEIQKIIDIHAHIFPEKIAEKAVEAIGNYYGAKMPEKGTVDALIESGRQIGVYKYVVHSTATKVEQVMAINDFIAESVAANRSFIGFGTLHPGFKKIKDEVDRIIKLGLKGIKLHPEFQGFSIDDDEMMPIYQAVEKKLPILMHMGDENKTSSSPARLAKVIDMFPGLTVIAAHFGGYMMWDDSIRYLVGRNVYFDTSSSLWKLDRKKALDIIRKHGADKILFGTDFPMWSHQDEFQRFQKLGLTKGENELILWKNASRLLGTL
ncbi:MAG TPA: amidohydrolase [Clostridiaceae bacterium]|nr:amidohydrolase [Clostridiaceae bacterium]